jgi:uncharacterized protein (TIGR02679 family)
MNDAAACALCADTCVDADLAPLLSESLHWLWTALADVADRRGDPALTEGRVAILGPADPAERAAATGLLGSVPMRPGVRRQVDLAALTERLRIRGQYLTPGAVAAHATGRRLAARAAARLARIETLEALRAGLDGAMSEPGPVVMNVRLDPPTAWARIHATGWATRLAALPDGRELLAHAVRVLASLPSDGRRTDRRTLVAGDPHALDEGSVLGGLVLALAGLSGTAARPAWHALGVNLDDLTGGLLALGLYPAGWHLPADTVVTLPPRELARCCWPAPQQPGQWVFVTENPSVLSAAAASVIDSAPLRLFCTAGTPSAAECAAIGRLAACGWQVAVRADFDVAGLAHVRALLAACPNAVPWRMAAADYVASAPAGGELTISSADTPWDVELATVMSAVGGPAFEEALLPELLADLCAGHPPISTV